MKGIKYLIVAILDKLDAWLDQIPRYTEGRWWRDGDWGCSLGLSRKSAELDEQWQTGYWEGGDEEVLLQGPSSEERPDDGAASARMG